MLVKSLSVKEKWQLAAKQVSCKIGQTNVCRAAHLASGSEV